MNDYNLDRLNDFDDLNDVNGINKLNKESGTRHIGNPSNVGNIGNVGKKIVMIILLILAVAVPVAVYLFSAGNEKVEVEKVDKKVDKGLVDTMLNELQVERALMEQEKQRLAEQQRNLKKFESELDKKYTEYLRKAQQLADKEEEFNNKVELRSVDRQTMETYESIDSEQAAVLLKNLYSKDPSLVILVMRKISGRRAGKILEAMILIDKELSVKIAQESLNYYRVK